MHEAIYDTCPDAAFSLAVEHRTSKGMSQLFILKHVDSIKCNGDCALCRYGVRENDIATGCLLCIKQSEQHCRSVREVVSRILHLVFKSVFQHWFAINSTELGEVFLHPQFVSVYVCVYRIDKDISIPPCSADVTTHNGQDHQRNPSLQQHHSNPWIKRFSCHRPSRRFLDRIKFAESVRVRSSRRSKSCFSTPCPFFSFFSATSGRR